MPRVRPTAYPFKRNCFSYRSLTPRPDIGDTLCGTRPNRILAPAGGTRSRNCLYTERTLKHAYISKINVTVALHIEDIRAILQQGRNAWPGMELYALEKARVVEEIDQPVVVEIAFAVTNVRDRVSVDVGLTRIRSTVVVTVGITCVENAVAVTVSTCG
jgi:hypothetical protein